MPAKSRAVEIAFSGKGVVSAELFSAKPSHLTVYRHVSYDPAAIKIQGQFRKLLETEKFSIWKVELFGEVFRDFAIVTARCLTQSGLSHILAGIVTRPFRRWPTISPPGAPGLPAMAAVRMSAGRTAVEASAANAGAAFRKR
ncbi:MAG: hypothetical protein ACLPSF_08920 [Methylocella sp.]